MRVICKSVSEGVSKNDIDRYTLHNNTVYEVIAIHIFDDNTYYVMMDRYNRRMFVPVYFFHIVSGIIPARWHFSMRIHERGAQSALFGYKEFATDNNHFSELFELEPDAVRIFEEEFKQRTAKIEQFDLVKLLITIPEINIPENSLGSISKVIGGNDNLFEVEFFKNNGDNFEPIVVPRVYISLYTTV